MLKPDLLRPSPFHRCWQWLRKDPLLLVLLACLPVLLAVSAAPLSSVPMLVDWPTLAALTGLLLLTKGVELSGGLQHAGAWLVRRMDSERGLAVVMVLASAALSTVLTNDVALFVVVPLTVGVARRVPLPLVRLVVFEALAVNAGSALTPIGNPQNLFLWRLSQQSFADFMLHMAPLVGLCLALLLVVAGCAFRGRRIALVPPAQPQATDRLLLGMSLALYLPFLVLTELRLAGVAVAGLALVFLLVRRRVLLRVDGGLLLVFVLMFVDLRLLAGLGAVRELVAGWGLEAPAQLYIAGVALSQLVSNVPAAIALAAYSSDWKTLAYAVNVGGFGLLVGSLANLIALRLAGQSGAWRVFHAYSIPFLLVVGCIVYALWFGRVA